MNVRGMYKGNQITYISDEVLMVHTKEGVTMVGPKLRIINLIDKKS